MKYIKLILSLGLALSLLPFTFPASAGLHAEVSPQVWADTAGSQAAELLVSLRPAADIQAISQAALAAGQDPAVPVVNALRQVAQASQAGLLADLQARGIPYRAYWITNLVMVRGDQALVNSLALRPEVSRIESNRSFPVALEDPEPALAPASPAQAATVQWGLTQVGAPVLWGLGFTGQGIVVASADTGVRWDHPALKAHYRGWDGTTADHNYNWWDAIHAADSWSGTSNCLPDQAVPCDDYGHGTHTTGTMVGDDGAGMQIGMAPGAKWIGCRNMYNGNGRPNTYIECLQFLTAPWPLGSTSPYTGDPTRHADVIDNSYSCPSSEGCSTNSLKSAVEAVRAAGIFMAVSAGNKGSGCASVNEPPGTYQAVFSVGATDSTNTIAGFSSRGPASDGTATWKKPQLSAPGVGVLSAWPPVGYTSLSGTSMAAPHVAGAVALLWSAFPGLKNHVIYTENLLESSATPLTTTQACGGDTSSSVPNNTYGYGLLNVSQSYTYANMPERRFIPLVIP